MAKVYEMNNIVLDTSSETSKYNIDTTGYTKEEFEFPLGIGKFYNVYIGRKDEPSCTQAYSEIENVNRV